MPARLLFEIADLAFHPNLANFDFDDIFDAAQQLGDGQGFGGHAGSMVVARLSIKRKSLTFVLAQESYFGAMLWVRKHE
jgi:hypothetical protein